ncbi:MAG: hypothetical protein HYW00_02270, partial [Candidatus Colwellbacteria bacterium]|nr:hypothetical protein [Candidatus Colwellbacteria bacterium]
MPKENGYNKVVEALADMNEAIGAKFDEVREKLIEHDARFDRIDQHLLELRGRIERLEQRV